jgi:TonB family protein
MRDSQTKTRLLSFTIAIAVHAAVLFGSGFVSQPPAFGGDGGSLNVELVEAPPGGEGVVPARAEPAPPHEQPVPEPATPNSRAELLPVDEMVLPDPDAEFSPPPSPIENPKPLLVGTNLTANTGDLIDHPGDMSAGNLPRGAALGNGTGGNGGGAAWGDPRYGSNPLPVYPVEARKMGQQGTVLLSALLNSQGTVETLAVKESSGHVLLDQAAFRAIRHWHFRPATVAGITVSSPVEIPVTFRLIQ